MDILVDVNPRAGHESLETMAGVADRVQGVIGSLIHFVIKKRLMFFFLKKKTNTSVFRVVIHISV